MVNLMKIKYSTIQWFLSCFIILWLNAGNFEYIQGFFPQVIKFGLVLLWFFITSLIYRGFLELYLSKAAPILIMIAIILLSKSFGNVRYFNLYWMSYLYYAIIFAVFVCSFYFYDERESKALLLVLILDIVIVAIHTFIELTRNPILVRAMSTSVDSRMAILNGVIPTGVGGYGMCYQLVFCSMLLVLLLDEKIQHRIWIYLSEMLIFCVLFSAQITLALIMQVVGVAAVLMCRNDRKSFIWKMVFLVVLVILLLNLNSILQYLISYAGDDMAMRLEELMRIREISAESSGDVASRYRLYWKSFSVFLQNPFWGDFGGTGIGCHSTFIDLLGAYGLLGIFGIIGFLRPIQLTLKHFELRSVKHNLLVFFFMTIVLATINVLIGSDIMLATTIAIPLFFKVLYSQEDCYENY